MMTVRLGICGLLWALLLAGLGTNAGRAQEAGEGDRPHPLEPLDTSSPRATLASFLGATAAYEQAAADDLVAPSRDAAGTSHLVGQPPLSDAGYEQCSRVGAGGTRAGGGHASLGAAGAPELPPLEEVPDETAFEPDKPPDSRGPARGVRSGPGRGACSAS